MLQLILSTKVKSLFSVFLTGSYEPCNLQQNIFFLKISVLDEWIYDYFNQLHQLFIMDLGGLETVHLIQSIHEGKNQLWLRTACMLLDNTVVSLWLYLKHIFILSKFSHFFYPHTLLNIKHFYLTSVSS